MKNQTLFSGLLSTLLLAASLTATAAPITYLCSTTGGSANCSGQIPDAIGNTPGQIVSTIPVAACAGNNTPRTVPTAARPLPP